MAPYNDTRFPRGANARPLPVILSSQSAATSSSGSDGSPPHSSSSVAHGEVPLLPDGEYEWEAMRPVIEELYVTKNLALRSVAQIMRVDHGFKASERMYKTRLSKWGLRKSTQAKAMQSTRLGRQTTKQLINSAQRGYTLQDNHLGRGTRMLMHESRGASMVDAAMRQFRSYTISWSETDPRWRQISKYKSDSLSVPQFNLKDSLRSATRYLEDGNFVEGGRFLRLAFLSIEEVLQDDHLYSAGDLFVACPLMFFKLPQPLRDQLILAYTKYLHQQASIVRQGHPIFTIARSMHHAAAAGGMGRVIAFISRLNLIQYDTLINLRGLDVASANKLSFFAHGVKDRDLLLRSMHDFMKIAQEASLELGDENMDALVLWAVALTLRADLEMYDDTFLSIAETITTISSKRYDLYQHMPPDSWVYDYFENWIYRNCHFMFMKYWIFKRKPENMLMHGQAMVTLYGKVDGVWKMFAAAGEKLYRQNGYEEEADALASRRKELDMPPGVRELLEKEEASYAKRPTGATVTEGESDDDSEDE